MGSIRLTDIKSRIDTFLTNTDEHYGDYFHKFKMELQNLVKELSSDDVGYYEDEIEVIIAQILEYPSGRNKKPLLELCNIIINLIDAKNMPPTKFPKGEEMGTQRDKSRSVFVIHGRNSEARKATFMFLRSLDLHPLEWPEIVSLTGKTSPYIGEIIDTAFKNVQATIILFTGDDEAKLRDVFSKSNDSIFEKTLTPQARPNVLFEAGWAIGKYPKRTVIVEIGNLRPFSDIWGRHVIRMDNSIEKRNALIQRLSIAKCQLNNKGTDWISVGDFEGCIR